jgi:hypothetical protein
MNQIKNLIGKKFDYFMLTKTGFKISAGGHTLSIKAKNVASDFSAKLVKGEVITAAYICYHLGSDATGGMFGQVTIHQGHNMSVIGICGDL